MVIALRLLCLLAVLLLAACYKTDLPSASNRYSSKTVTTYSSYTVRSGDTLYRIAKRFGLDYRLLAKRNHLAPPYRIFVGQRIYLTSIAPKSKYMPLPKTQASVKPPSRTHQASRSISKPKPKPRVTRVTKPKPTAKPSTHSVASAGSVHLQWPASGKVTSLFGMRNRRMHDGIDIGAPEEAPVYAAAAGEVVYSDSRLSGYGKLIIIRHSKDMFTAYAHNQRNLVRKGDTVKKGDVVARIGQTGRATGPHLHFEVRRGSTPVDPLSYLPRRK